MRIAGLIQARMGSKRLPGKVMLEIESKPLIGHIFDRLRQVKGLKKLILKLGLKIVMTAMTMALLQVK